MTADSSHHGMDMSLVGSFPDEKILQVNTLLLELVENTESLQVVAGVEPKQGRP